MKIKYHSKRYGTLEMKIRAFVLEDIEDRANSVYEAEFKINNCIPTIKTGNATQAEWFFKAFISEDNKTCEVWHLNNNGDKDRLIASITKE